MNFYDELNNGNKYVCDKCNVVNLSEFEYSNYIQWQYHYCELCWNYIHLKKGSCNKCGNTMTNRSEYPKIIHKCDCGGIIIMEIGA